MNVTFPILLFILNFIWTNAQGNSTRFSILNKNQNFTDYLLCRECGADITPLRALINIPSPFAVSQINATIFGLQGVLVQELHSGADGPLLEVITVSRSNCVGSSKFSYENSWFPGFAWRPCLCSHCLLQIGWVFDIISSANDKVLYTSSYGFYALMVKSIVNELYADNLIVSDSIIL